MDRLLLQVLTAASSKSILSIRILHALVPVSLVCRRQLSRAMRLGLDCRTSNSQGILRVGAFHKRAGVERLATVVQATTHMLTTKKGSSTMKRSQATLLVAAALAIVALVASVASAAAFPSDTQKTGEPCSTCHVNPAGGGGLTAAGQAYKQTGSLPSAAPAAPAPAAPAPAAPAPAAPAPAAQPSAPAPAALPSTGEGAVASALPSILGTLGLFTAGLGYGMARIGRRRR